MLLLRGSDGARDGARRSGAFSDPTIAFGIFAANVAIHHRSMQMGHNAVKTIDISVDKDIDITGSLSLKNDDQTDGQQTGTFRAWLSRPTSTPRPNRCTCTCRPPIRPSALDNSSTQSISDTPELERVRWKENRSPRRAAA
jgi:hypothetical protein